MINDVILLIGYAILGAGIKYIDMAYDDNMFNKTTANIIALISAAIMGALIITDQTSAVIFMAIITAAILTGKTDNDTFKICATGMILTYLLSRMTLTGDDFITTENAIALTTLIISGVLDEKGNDWYDRKRNALIKPIWITIQEEGIIEKFFKHRGLMKITVLWLCIIGYFNFIYFIAFILFDLAYDLVNFIGKNMIAD